jgi:M3 family oligoendopeptidase
MVKFKDLEYVRPDSEKVEKELTDATVRLENASSFEEAKAAFLDFSETMSHFYTMDSIANIRNTVNMADEFYDAERAFFDEASPKLMPVMKRASGALIRSPFRAEFEELYGKQLIKNYEVQEKLMSEEIIAPSIEENTLSSEYSKIAASCSVDFHGEKCNFYGLLRHMQSTDRKERREAFIEWAKLYEGIAPKLDEIYTKLVAVRCDIASKLGFDSYIDYIYPQRGRYDYDAAKVAEFREAVRKYITPVCAEMYEEQRKRIGVDKLSWYDEDLVFPDGNAIPIGTPEELVSKAKKMYENMSPETAEYFDFMVEYELLDLVTRENKHLGGYCTFLPDFKAPFIFSNFNQTSADVDVLTHEAGHAFEAYYASRRLPLDDLTWSTSEINEIHSMTMEHFTYPYMESFFGDKADKYRFAHFCEALKTIPYLVCVDEFQHRVFEKPDATSMERRAIWREIEQKYMPWRDYDGNEFLEGGGFWMQKQHIFLYPFYYIDYALAGLGAFSLYRRKLEGGDAWGDYLTLCSIGGKYGYFETLEKANIPIPLNDEVVKELAEFADRHSKELKKKI